LNTCKATRVACLLFLSCTHRFTNMLQLRDRFTTGRAVIQISPNDEGWNRSSIASAACSLKRGQGIHGEDLPLLAELHNIIQPDLLRKRRNHGQSLEDVATQPSVFDDDKLAVIESGDANTKPQKNSLVDVMGVSRSCCVIRDLLCCCPVVAKPFDIASNGDTGIIERLSFRGDCLVGYTRRLLSCCEQRG
jgi:hypothetical protein